MNKPDVFLCHASEDKATFVKPLALRLQELSVRVWYDEFVIEVGDRLSEKIADGLATCRHGLIVFSPSFLGKPWTSYEISGLLNRFIEERLRLLPIWLGIGRSEIAAFNPAIADLKAISGNPREINRIALEILRIVRPTLYENIKLMGRLNDPKVKFASSDIPIKDLKIGRIRHHDLPKSLLIRIQNIYYASRDVLDFSLEETIENFQRDLMPEHEVEIWEKILSTVQKAMDYLETTDVEVKKKVLYYVMGITSPEGVDKMTQETANDPNLRRILTAAFEAYLEAVPNPTVTDVDEED